MEKPEGMDLSLGEKCDRNIDGEPGLLSNIDVSNMQVSGSDDDDDDDGSEASVRKGENDSYCHGDDDDDDGELDESNEPSDVESSGADGESSGADGESEFIGEENDFFVDDESEEDESESDADDASEDSHIENIRDVDKEKIKKEMSIYKVLNSTIGIPKEFDGDEKALEKKITDTFLQNQNNLLKYHHLEDNKCEPYHMCLLTYQNKTKDPVTEIASQRGAVQTEYKMGRQTGCIIVFFRFKEHKIPEIFLLCSGNAYIQILSFVDVEFRTDMIKHFLCNSNIKRIEYCNLTGLEIKSISHFRINIEDFFKKFDFFEKIITTISGDIEKESALAKCISTKKVGIKDLRIDFGAFKVKILKRMECKKWAEIFELVSATFNENAGKEMSQTQQFVIDALEAVQKVKDPIRVQQLSKSFERRITDVMATNMKAHDLYLSSNIPEDFTMASSFQLQIRKTKQGNFKTIESWNSSPSFENVMKSLHEYSSYQQRLMSIRKDLRRRRIRLSFSPVGLGRRKQMFPIQYMVHGSVEYENVRYYKMNRSWFHLSPQYSDIINKRFKCFTENAVCSSKTSTKSRKNTEEMDTISHSLSKVLKYPWLEEKRLFGSECVQKILKINKTEAEDLISILIKHSPSVCNEQGKICLTKNENVFLLPTSLELIGDVYEIISKSNKQQKDKENANTGTKSKDEGTGNKGSKKESKQIAVTYLWKLSRNDEACEDDLKKTLCETRKTLLGKENETKVLYEVDSPILSKEGQEELNDKLSKLEIEDVLSCLRSLIPLSESEYNELYLHPRVDDFVVIPGDRVLVNSVELYDILIYNADTKTTYLVHNKDGFDYKLRDACSQIRVSSQLFWMDFLKGTHTQAEGFWKAGTSDTTGTVYRIQLMEKLEQIGKEKFMSFFDDDVTLVFVLGFRDNTKKDILVSPDKVKSTIAKIELLTLDAHFAKYQIGGGRKFQLKLFQLESKVGQLKNKKPPKRKGATGVGPTSKKGKTKATPVLFESSN